MLSPAKARTTVLLFDVRQDDVHQLADLRSARDSALAVVSAFVASFLDYSHSNESKRRHTDVRLGLLSVDSFLSGALVGAIPFGHLAMVYLLRTT